VTIEAGAVTIEMTDIMTDDLLHQVVTMTEVMTDMINMIATTTVLQGTARSLVITTTILGIGTLGSTGIERGTTRTGTGGRRDTERGTGTGTMTDMTGHPGITMRGIGTMTGDMTGIPHPTTTPAVAGDLLPLDLHHIGDLTTRNSWEDERAELLSNLITLTSHYFSLTEGVASCSFLFLWINIR